MESTMLTLLCSDGTIRATFIPALNALQYIELREIVTAASKTQELSEKLAIAAVEWRVQLDVQRC